MKNLITKYGPYVLVTGASSGIGKEFANQLAELGFNLITVARRKSILDSLAKNLKSKYNIEIKTIGLDLTESDAIEQLIKETEYLEIGLIIINAAALTMGSFLKNNIRQETDLLYLNTQVPLKLIHYFGNKMKQKGRGGIILVSSMAGHSAAPYQANYAASKAYIFSLGQALNYELNKSNIDVTVLSPGLTNTEGIDNAKDNGVDFSKLPFTIMETSEVVLAALNGLGKKMIVIPGAKNNFFDFMTKYLTPRAFGIKMSGKLIEKSIDRALI
tara:strand:+ start:12594 stop:13409 length:816 start_codon:yes stop_codon:yes gene_type:complete